METEGAGGPRHISAVSSQRRGQDRPFESIDDPCLGDPKVLVLAEPRGAPEISHLAGKLASDIGGEIGRPNDIVAAENRRPFDGVGPLADVAGP